MILQLQQHDCLWLWAGLGCPETCWLRTLLCCRPEVTIPFSWASGGGHNGGPHRIWTKDNNRFNCFQSGLFKGPAWLGTVLCNDLSMDHVASSASLLHAWSHPLSTMPLCKIWKIVNVSSSCYGYHSLTHVTVVPPTPLHIACICQEITHTGFATPELD